MGLKTHSCCEEKMMKTIALHTYDHDQGGASWTAYGANSNSEPSDYTSRDGASALKQKIEAYWRERGLDVMLSLHNVGFHPAIRAARYDVRSDMVNGLPRGALKAPPAHEHKTSLVETETDYGDDGDDWID
jgi:hypothetical protein